MSIRMNLSALRYRIADACRRARTAVAFYRGRVNDDQAYDLAQCTRDHFGSWPIVTIDADQVLERLRDTYQDNPDLPRLAAEAAERVYNKWPGDDSDLTSSLVDWAVDIAEGYAKTDGIRLVPIEDDLAA